MAMIDCEYMPSIVTCDIVQSAATVSTITPPASGSLWQYEL